MKTLLKWPYPLLLVLSMGSLSTGTRAQNKAGLAATTSLAEIINWLDNVGLPRARISLKNGSYEEDGLSEELVFSDGFRLLTLDGCRLTLKNDQIKIIGWWTYNPYMSLRVFLEKGRRGEKPLTPQSGVLVIPLNKLRYKERKPYLYTKKPDVAKEFGMWRIKFHQKAFIKQRPLEMKITAAEDPNLISTMNAETLTFTFEDKQESESFRVAFNRAIKLCQGK